MADRGYSVCQTYDGGYIVTGCTAILAPNAWDVYLIKTDSLGMVVWDTIFGTPGWDEGWSVRQTPDSGYVVAGMTTPPSNKKSEVYLVKVDRSGQVVPRIDVAVTGIKEPPDTDFVDMSYDVTASVRNLGNAPDSFAVTATIDGYSDVYPVNHLAAGREIEISFQHDWLVPPDDSTTYVMTVCARTLNDIDTTRDCMQKMIFAYYDPTGTEEAFDRQDESGFRLYQNEPNPFQKSTVIQYSLPAECDVTLAVYDVAGRPVSWLVSEEQGARIHDVRWDAGAYASGVYFYRLQAREFTQTRKMILAR